MKKQLLLWLLIFPMALFAQKSRTVTGKVISENDGMPLPGVSIYIDNSTVGVEYSEGVISNYNRGTVSDINGAFSFEIPQAITKLTFSMIGFDNYILDLTNKASYQVFMSEAVSELDEVVVTGYQEIKNRKVTASISKIEAQGIMQNSTGSVDNMLTGQIAGVQTTPVSGAPGAPAKIRIRGTSSLSGTQEPLWVLDGMPLEGNDLPDMDGKDVDQLINSSIAGVNPADIESITVLKDAAATAIYGTRAANGVIVITTKSGKKGSMKVDVSTNWFVNTRPDMSRLNLLNSNQKVDLELALAARTDLTYRKDKGQVARILNGANEWDLFQTSGYDALSADTKAGISRLRNTNTNWGNELYQSALSQNHSVSISGGNEKAHYYFSAGYYDEEGTTIGTSLNRINLTLKTDFQLNDKVNFGVSLFTNRRKQGTYLISTDSFTNPSRYSRTANPYLAIYDEDGKYVYDPEIDGYSDRNIDYNIMEERKNTSNELDVLNTMAVLDLNYDINDWLRFKSQFGVTVDKSENEKIAMDNSYAARKTREKSRRFKDGEPYYFLPEGGVINNFRENTNQWNLKNMLYFSKSFNDLHDLDLMVGSELRRNETNRLSSAGYGYDNQTLTTVPVIFPDEETAKEYSLYHKFEVENAFASFFATANYAFKDKYSVFGSLRYDGSDLFGVDPKYKYLPLYSMGGAWNVNEEEWLKNAGWLTYLKLRASYGLQGNIDKSTSPFIVGEYKTASILPGTSEKTVNVMSPPNDKLRWEKTSTWNAGVDMGIFKNRIKAAVDVYHRRSEDLIGPQAIPVENGFFSVNRNWAEITNKGIELVLTTKNIASRNFEWSTSINLSKNINRVEKIHVNNNQVIPSVEGYSINTFFALPTNGLDEQGYPIFVKDGKDMSVTEFFELDALWGIPELVKSNLSNEELRGLYKEVGSRDPKWTGGIINNFHYKNWTLNISANFNLKQWVKETPFYSMTQYDRGTNTTSAIYSVWTQENTSGKYPGIVGADSFEGGRALDYFWMTGNGQAMDAFSDLDIWYKEISYIRINSIRMGYTVPQKLCHKLGLASAKVNLEAKNPFVFGSDYSGYFDPETYGNIYSQPIAKSIMMGLNLSF
ncbi:SusC/RagA family TonB-linked outer membrane protein [Marinilabiliaceae bacterium JC017]|nr:SusC/RagA family TonB-linked outer membrane protein [Marinilabiliaceae bacterium JC017]